MKGLPFSFFILLAAFSFPGVQVKSPVKKIYAYKQALIPGIAPKKIAESGAGEKEQFPRFNYWFYVETYKKEKIIISDLWISGKRFSATNEMITQTPVKKIIYTAASGPDTITLIPETSNPVILTYPSGLLRDSSGGSRYLSGLIKKNELVIGYYREGKKYFAPVKAIKKLEAEALP